MNNKHNYRDYIKEDSIINSVLSGMDRDRDRNYSSTTEKWYKMLYNRQLLIRSVACFRTNGIDIDYINRNEIVHKYE